MEGTFPLPDLAQYDTEWLEETPNLNPNDDLYHYNSFAFWGGEDGSVGGGLRLLREF